MALSGPITVKVDVSIGILPTLKNLVEQWRKELDDFDDSGTNSYIAVAEGYSAVGSNERCASQLEEVVKAAEAAMLVSG